MRAVGFLFWLAFIAFGLAQIVAGYQGIAYHWGPWWAVALGVLSFIFRFSLPVTIAAFFGAKDVWEWHWFFALLFAAPGLAFTIPAIGLNILASLKEALLPERRHSNIAETAPPQSNPPRGDTSNPLVAVLIIGVVVGGLIYFTNQNTQGYSYPRPAEAPQSLPQTPAAPQIAQPAQFAPTKTPQEIVSERYPEWEKTLGTKEFRDWYAAMPVGTQDLAKSNDPKDLIQLLDLFASDQEQKRLQAERMNQAVARLDAEHPGWQDVVKSADFRAWLRAKPESEQAKFRDSWDADYIGGVIERYKTMAEALATIRAAPSPAASPDTPAKESKSE